MDDEANDGTPATDDGGTPRPDDGTPRTADGDPVTDDGGTPDPDGGTPDPDGGTPDPDGGTPGPEDDGADDEAVLGFDDLGLSDDLLAALAGLGHVTPTPIQAESIPPLLDGFDLLGQAATGTGKTAAFALPMLDRVADAGRSGSPFGLVLVPTRELCNQVAEAMRAYGAEGRARIVALFGGAAIGPQLRSLGDGVEIVIGTPGRVLDHLKRGSLDLGSCAMVVLDEADEMLDMGFAEDLEAILDAAPAQRQTVLFSATMPSRIDSIASRQLDDPVRISIARADDTAGTTPLVAQRAHLVHRTHRAAAVGRVLDMERPEAAIVFCRTRGDVDELTEALNARGDRAEALHGGMGQEQRDRAMGRLKRGVATLLVATDVAARGIDVDHLTHVVNVDLPQTAEAYTHRIGRVGRAGREGVAITFGGPRDRRRFEDLARRTGHPIPIEPLPSIADVVARRLEATAAELVARLGADEPADGHGATAGGDDPYRAIVTRLAADHDPTAIAAAAVRLLHEASGRERDEVEIPEVHDRGKQRTDRPRRAERGAGGDRRDRGRDDRAGRGERRPGGAHHVEAGFVSLQFDVGRSSGVRPGDLVGAIANTADIRGSDIGAIKINDRSAFVQVPERHAGTVLRSMEGAKIRNRSVRVRRART